jgi:uncharacterized protein (TIGR03084 family)
MDKPTVASLTADLIAEQNSLDAVVESLAAEDWERATPSPRWAVRDQIGHLAFFDMTAALAIDDPEGFVTHRESFVAAAFASATSADDATLGETRAMSAPELLDHWRRQRTDLAAAAATCVDDARIEWYGPSMGAKSFLTARLMEAWAHGQDICDTVGVEREPTGRLRHIAQLGYITRGWTYINRGLNVPAGDVQVTLTSPSGETWEWGPDQADATVTGSALDFCLVTAVEGEIAVGWLAMAQLFAGPPSDPPAPQD